MIKLLLFPPILFTIFCYLVESAYESYPLVTAYITTGIAILLVVSLLIYCITSCIKDNKLINKGRKQSWIKKH